MAQSSNKNRYVAFKLPEELVAELYDIGQLIKEKCAEVSLNFIPMEYNEIHMTVCFLGELSKNLKDKKKEKLELIQKTIDEYPAVNGLTFDKYELFSVKKNLIVAKFNLSEETRKKIIKFKQQFVQYGAPL